ncbi:hypothetical protein LC612_23090 [Nostoc sp. CHAB 5834]|nr:hypothetical protein [Nostoc sp. CHAB 5834]
MKKSLTAVAALCLLSASAFAQSDAAVEPRGLASNESKSSAVDPAKAPSKPSAKTTSTPHKAEKPVLKTASVPLSGTAIDTTAPNPANEGAPLVAVEPVATPGVSASKPKFALDVNPFTGKPLTVEQVQRQLEENKLRTAVLEETLKQSNLREELGNIPLRKSVEAEQARTALKKEVFSQKDIEEKAKLAAEQAASAKEVARAQAKAAAEQAKAAEAQAKAAAAAAAQAKKQSSKTTSSKSSESGMHEATPPKVVKPILLSVMDVGGSRSAVIDFDGNTLMAQDGEMTPEGPVRVLDGKSVEINGKKYSVHANTLGRFVASDVAPMKQDTGSKGGVSVAISPTQVMPVNTTTPLPPVGGQRATLPPIQLPAGVPVFNAPR